MRSARTLRARIVTAVLIGGIVLNLVPPWGGPVAVRAAAGAPLLILVDSTAQPLDAYLQEILNVEGVKDYELRPLGDLSSALLAGRRAVLLGESAPTADQIALLDNFVGAGGGLVAMRPAAGLDALLGVTTQGGTTAEGYVRITDATLGAGLYNDTMQFHGTANHYALAGATQVAELYGSRATTTGRPAVTLANRGAGKAALFSYDLASSVALTRQGNPANANVDTDGDGIVRTIDIFRGWIDLERTRVPQADMQQRLLVRLLQAVMAQPLPRLWYFPNAAPTVVVATADAHANPDSYFQSEIDALQQIGATATFYVTTAGNPSPGVLNGWRALGFDFAPHPYVDCGYACGFTNGFNWFQNTYGFAPRTVRTHQVRWSGWTDAAAVGADHGVGLDFNFYQWASWLTTASGAPALGYMGGSGQPMRFIAANGTILPIYQQHTLLVDEELGPHAGLRGLTLSAAVAASRQVIDDSIGGYYTPITTQYHVDYFYPDNSTWAIQSTQYALQRGAISLHADSWLTFVEQRAATTVANSIWSGNTLSFTVGAGGTGQTLLVPLQYGGNTLASITVGGATAAYTTMMVNGAAFAAVPAQSGNYVATYAPDTTPPTTIGTTPAAGASNVPAGTPIGVTFSEPMDRTAAQGAFALTPGVAGAFSWDGPGTTMTFTPGAPLAPSTNYTATVSAAATDLAGNPLATPANWSFTTAATTPPPTVTGVSPISGPVGGGTSVTISGSGFTGASAVSFGGTPAASYAVGSDTAITAVAPAHAAGTVDITVTTPVGTSATAPAARFTFTDGAGALAVTAIDPATGPTAGGAAVTITGANFATGATVTFGGVAATAVTVTSTTSLVATPPAHTSGAIDVVVTNPGGGSATLAGGYTYVACPTACLSHTTAADFAGGTLGAGGAIAQSGDGEVQLAPAAGAEFAGGALPGGWSATPWSAGGAATVADGQITVDGTLVATDAYYGPGRALEFVAAFDPAAPFQHIGFGIDLNNTPWAIFSTGSLGGALYARTNSGAGQTDTLLGGNWLGAPHRFRIEWTPTGMIFSIDGTQVAAHALTIPGDQRPVISDGPVGGDTLSVDWLRVSPYATSGTYTSRVFDAAGAATWGTAAWTATVPPGTTLTVSARTGTTPTPDASWGAFAPVTNGAALGDNGRYLQYRVALATTDPDRTPALRDLTIGYAVSGPLAPTITSVSPASGPADGGTAVTITGANFAAGATVSFGGTAATGVTVAGSATITATAPAHPSGAVDVVVTNPDGQAGTVPGGFLYTAAPPAVTGLSPATGPTAGGTTVTLAGTGFTGATGVSFGGTPAAAFTVVSDTSISATAPARAAGTVTVAVTTPAGTSPAGPANAYTYQDLPPAPQVRRVTPGTGPASGDTTVTITGANLSGASGVTFGGTAATGVTIVSATTVTAIAPAHAAGAVDVRVTTPSGVSATGPSARFTYVPCPDGCMSETAVAHFGGGTANSTYIAATTDGEVTLAPTAGAEFGGGALPAGWSAAPWGGGGGATVADGSVAVDGALVAPAAYHGPGRVLEFVATFDPAAPFQHAGLGVDLNNVPWAIFSTGGAGGALYARTNSGAGQVDTPLPGAWLGAPHLFRIEWTASAVAYFIDGAPVASHPLAIGGDLRPVLSDGPVGGGTLTVDWLRLGPYAPAGHYLSGILDAGGGATWGVAAWAADVPAGTGLTVSARTGNTPAPDATWTAFAPLTNGATVGTAGRYLQYRVELTSGDPAQSPAFHDLTIGFTISGVPAPVITGLSPASGSAAGGTVVAITGTGFTGATAVSFGGTAATFTVVSDTSITATAPTHAAGVVDVIVIGPGGGSAPTAASRFTYAAAPPAVNGLSPSSGPTTGGTVVTLTGTGFTGATGVSFGGTPATTFTVVSDTSVTATAPPHAAGTVTVAVTTPAGTSPGTAANEYTYLAPAPSVEAIAPATGGATGGTVVAISGANLGGATGVSFGGTPAAAFTVNSDTNITATAPPHAPGTVDVRVTTPGGTSPAIATARFTYVPCPDGCITRTTVADFGTGTAADTRVAQDRDGEVALALALGAEFGGGALPPELVAAPWGAGGAATVGGGALTVDGALVAATGYHAPGRTLEFVATFAPAAPFQHAGLGIDLNNTPWAIFSTGSSGGTLYARTIAGGGQADTPLPGDWLGAPHLFRIEWTTAGVTYLIDGEVVANHALGNTGDLRPVISDGPAGGATLAVDWLRLGPYSPAGTYTSAVLDAGGDATWETVAWTADVPAGTSLAVSVRAGNTPTPDASWSAFAPVANGATAGATGRYLQYQVALTTGDPSRTPAFHDLTIGYAINPLPPPAVTGLSPASGPAAGGTVVTISGSGFSGATAVRFGATAATTFTVGSTTTITATAPAGSGTVDVTVTTPQGTSAASPDGRFTYTAAPTVASVSPNSGPLAGGTEVTIAGGGFVAGATVTFGGTAATNVTVTSVTSITATTPARAAGAVVVTVRNPDGQSGSLANGFTYRAAPTATGISPNQGTTAGNTQVTVSGTGFVAGQTRVTFDGLEGTNVAVSSATRLTVRSPAHAAGTVAVVVITPGGASAPVQFTYGPPPTIADVSPNAGPLAGGTAVTITGTNFTGATRVLFGSATASYTVDSATTITATAPGRSSAGTVTVRVDTPFGSATSPTAERYTYAAPPTVTSITPTSGPTGGGTVVTINGTAFTGATAVTFGAVGATSFTVVSATRIRATAPPGAAGVVNIRVTTPGGTSAAATASAYTYTAGAGVPAPVAAGETARPATGARWARPRRRPGW